MRYFNDITITGLITAIICFTGAAVHAQTNDKKHQEQIAQLHVQLAAKGAVIAMDNVQIEKLQMDKEELKSALGMANAMLTTLCKVHKTSVGCLAYSGAGGEIIKEQLSK